MDVRSITSKDCAIQRLDHLGLVAGMCAELGLVEYIDQHIPAPGPDKKVSYGTLVLGMVLNGLGYASQPLHMYPEFMKDKPIERLINADIQAEDFNQHALGRALDKVFDVGVSQLFRGFAEQAIQRLGLQASSLHLDSTSFHVDGEKYTCADKDEPQVVEITQGYSRNHRPDLNQVILNLIVENQAGMPVFLQASSGNSSDKKNFADIIKQHTASLKAALKNRYTVGDSAMCTPESLNGIHRARGYFVTRVPSTLTEAKELIAVTNQCDMQALGDGYFVKEVQSSYADIQQRWLLIFSERAYEREIKTLDKKITKGSEAELSKFRQLGNQVFACEKDAKEAIEKFKAKLKFLGIDDISIKKEPHYRKLGKPAKDRQPDYYNYYVRGCPFTCLKLRQEEQDKKGFFILTTNDLNVDTFTSQEVLSTYKSQQKVERGFRFLKSPEFLASSFFLKKPERIEALLMIMTLCLLICCALEYKIRQELSNQKQYFPDQKNKDTQRPTARWVFFCFQGISILIIRQEHRLVTNIMDRHRVILKILGELYQKIYS